MISVTGVPFHFQQPLGSFLEALRGIWLFCVWMVMLSPASAGEQRIRVAAALI
jgi:hypothetical protein